MMVFRSVKSSIITILANAAAGRYEVVQSQRQKQGAEDINKNKKVLVYFSRDEFKENSGTVNGEVQTMPTFNIVCEVSANGSYTDPDDPSTLVSAEVTADNELDELFEIIYQILMDARNMDLGLAVGTITNRYIKTIEKGEIAETGKTATIVGRMDLTLQAAESVLGETGVAGLNVKSELTIADSDGNTDDVAVTNITE